MTSIKCILALELYKFTGAEIEKIITRPIPTPPINKIVPGELSVHEIPRDPSILPEEHKICYYLRDDNTIGQVEDGFEDPAQPEKEYILIRQVYADIFLDEMISNGGMEEVVDMNMDILRTLPYTSFLQFNTYGYCNPRHIIIDCQCYGSDDDAEIECELHGYLNDEMELVRVVKKPVQKVK